MKMIIVQKKQAIKYHFLKMAVRIIFTFFFVGDEEEEKE